MNFADVTSWVPALLDGLNPPPLLSDHSPKFDISELLWGWIAELLGTWAERIRLRLLHSEQKEPLVWEREAYRMAAWIVTLAQEEKADPFWHAFIRMYGDTPENLQRKVDQMRAWVLRNELPPKKLPLRARAIGKAATA
jgi:hypothetical protein